MTVDGGSALSVSGADGCCVAAVVVSRRGVRCASQLAVSGQVVPREVDGVRGLVGVGDVRDPAVSRQVVIVSRDLGRVRDLGLATISIRNGRVNSSLPGICFDGPVIE